MNYCDNGISESYRRNIASYWLLLIELSNCDWESDKRGNGVWISCWLSTTVSGDKRWEREEMRVKKISSFFLYVVPSIEFLWSCLAASTLIWWIISLTQNYLCLDLVTLRCLGLPRKTGKWLISRIVVFPWFQLSTVR